MISIETIEQMIRQVPLYATGWQVCRAGTSVLIDGTEKVTKNTFLVIKPIAEVQSSQPLENFTPQHNDTEGV